MSLVSMRSVDDLQSSNQVDSSYQSHKVECLPTVLVMLVIRSGCWEVKCSQCGVKAMAAHLQSPHVKS